MPKGARVPSRQPRAYHYEGRACPDEGRVDCDAARQPKTDTAEPAKWFTDTFSLFRFPFSISLPFSTSHFDFSMFFYSIHKFIRNARNSNKTNITTHFYSIQNEEVLRSRFEAPDRFSSDTRLQIHRRQQEQCRSPQRNFARHSDISPQESR